MKRKSDFDHQLNGGGSDTRLAANGYVAGANALKKTRILIVEDEPAMVEGLRDNFEYEGYDVISAGDGAAGLGRGPSGEPRLVVFVLVMPPVRGLRVCQQLKAKRPPISIIMLSPR